MHIQAITEQMMDPFNMHICVHVCVCVCARERVRMRTVCMQAMTVEAI